MSLNPDSVTPLSELLDRMGRRTQDVEASDLLIQAAQEVGVMERRIAQALRVIDADDAAVPILMGET